MSKPWTLTAPDGRAWEGTASQLKILHETFSKGEVPVIGDKRSAAKLTEDLRRVQELLVTHIRRLDRMRKPTLSDRHAGLVYRRTLDTIRKLDDDIKQYFEIGGY